jgi:hypothetical protein
MMSLDYIRQMNQEAAREAAELGLEPYVYFDVAELHELAGFPFPFIGDLRPEGWELVDTHFVDSSGFGADDEPALSVRQFKALVEDHITRKDPNTLVGWAVIEAGQFQVYVGEFHRTVR